MKYDELLERIATRPKRDVLIQHLTLCNSGQAIALFDVLLERARQDRKWGTIDNFDARPLDRWLTILTEEVGELAEGILKKDQDNIVEEATQIAAVAIGILESVRRSSLSNRVHL